MFGDAVHPVYGAQAAGCWAPREAKIAVPHSTQRQGLNIHGALDLKTGQTSDGGHPACGRRQHHPFADADPGDVSAQTAGSCVR